MTSFTIRTATLSDFDGLLALYKELVGTIEVPQGETGKARLRDVLTHPGTQIYVAANHRVPVSMATLHVLPNMTFAGRPYALVENVVTLRSQQGLGLGRLVMQALEQAAWDAGAYKIMLLTGKQLGARGFYEKLGYSPDEKFGMTLRRAPKRNPDQAPSPAGGKASATSS